MLEDDVQAAFDGDPAAKNTDEIVLAIQVWSLSQFIGWLMNYWYKGYPDSRMMTEYAHSLTGIDIHPGAKIGRSFYRPWHWGLSAKLL